MTCDLPLCPVPFDLHLRHISDLLLANPGFGQPGRIDILLGVDIFVDILRHGWQTGPPRSPTAFETGFGWVLCGSAGSTTSSVQTNLHIATFQTLVTSGDDILRRFWEIEESPTDHSSLSMEERTVVRHFESNHSHTEEGRFIVPLIKKPGAKRIGKSGAQAVRRFLSLERSLTTRGCFKEFREVMQNTWTWAMLRLFRLQNWKSHLMVFSTCPCMQFTRLQAPLPRSELFLMLQLSLLLEYHLMIRSLLDQPSILRWLMFSCASDCTPLLWLLTSAKCIALSNWPWPIEICTVLYGDLTPRKTTAWPESPYGVSASSFATNMAVKQNAIDHAHEYPLAAEAVEKSFYVNDCLSGAASPESAMMLQQQLDSLFTCGGFLLRKWNPSVLQGFQQSSETLAIFKQSPNLISTPKLLVLSGTWLLINSAWRLRTFPPWQCNEKSCCIRHSKGLRCLGVVLTRHYQNENPPPMPMGNQEQLGWSSPWRNSWTLATVEKWTSHLGNHAHSPLLLTCWSDHCINATAWFQWCIWGSLCWSCLAAHGRFTWECSHLTCSLKDEGISNKASFHTQIGTLWRSSAHQTILSHQGDIPTTNELYLCLDGQHHCVELVFWQSQKIQNRTEYPTSMTRFLWIDGAICLVRKILPIVPLKAYFLSNWKSTICGGRYFTGYNLGHLLGQSSLTYLSNQSVKKKENYVTWLLSNPSSLSLPFDRFSNFTRLKRITAWILHFINNAHPSTLKMKGANVHPHLTVSKLSASENYWLSLV